MLRKNELFSSAVFASMLFMSALVSAEEKHPTITYSIGIAGLTCRVPCPRLRGHASVDRITSNESIKWVSDGL